MQNSPSIDWRFLLTHWKRILAAVLAGLLIAGLAFVLVAPLWEASALIQIGQIGGSTGPSGVSQIESPEAAAMKMMRPAFIEASV
jgi:uncharacterized protein involved in exopolysaccharide biosynthesis